MSLLEAVVWVGVGMELRQVVIMLYYLMFHIYVSSNTNLVSSFVLYFIFYQSQFIMYLFNFLYNIKKKSLKWKKKIIKHIIYLDWWNIKWNTIRYPLFNSLCILQLWDRELYILCNKKSDGHNRSYSKWCFLEEVWV